MTLDSLPWPVVGVVWVVLLERSKQRSTSTDYSDRLSVLASVFTRYRLVGRPCLERVAERRVNERLEGRDRPYSFTLGLLRN